MRTKHLLVIAAALIASTVWGAGEWTTLVYNDTYIYDARTRSGELRKTDTGIPIVEILGRMISKQTGTYTFTRWYVTVKDCRARWGTLVTTNMNGDIVQTAEFLEHGGSAASILAIKLCDAALPKN
jgi:hypothetical protein